VEVAPVTEQPRLWWQPCEARVRSEARLREFLDALLQRGYVRLREVRCVGRGEDMEATVEFDVALPEEDEA
jgi:hypothetical protein